MNRLGDERGDGQHGDLVELVRRRDGSVLVRTTSRGGLGQDFEAVAHALNTAPQKTLGSRTSAESFNEHLISLQQAGVASTI